MQELYLKYSAQGLQILAIPCNQFGGQEPQTLEAIKANITSKYGVTFPMFSKVDVKGDGVHALYKACKEATSEEPAWNFAQYLINGEGKCVKFYGHKSEPNNAIADIEACF